MPGNTRVLTNAAVLDVREGKLKKNQRVVIEEGRISCVEPADGSVPAGAEVVDVQGQTVMPGLSDAHVHLTAWAADLSRVSRSSPAYSAARAARLAEDMLMRGFTTVRDAAGAGYGLAQAVEEGYFKGPRILFCGQALSQTGGHGDQRGRGELQALGANHLSASVICDGVAAVRQACREQIRRGADQIKLMLSGGVASPTDKLTGLQFSEEEIRAAVEEAEMAGIYCMAHAYTAGAISRGLKCGVRSMEHCNLFEERNIEEFLEHDAFMVPTLATYEELAKEAEQGGLAPEVVEKLQLVLERGTESLQLAHEGGVKIVFGTDQLAHMQQEQLNEFAIRGRVQDPVDVIRAATINAAELYNEVGEIGEVIPGARADLLVVDGDPLEDLGVLQDPDRYLKVIMKGGSFYKNEL